MEFEIRTKKILKLSFSILVLTGLLLAQSMASFFSDDENNKHSPSTKFEENFLLQALLNFKPQYREHIKEKSTDLLKGRTAAEVYEIFTIFSMSYPTIQRIDKFIDCMTPLAEGKSTSIVCNTYWGLQETPLDQYQDVILKAESLMIEHLDNKQFPSVINQLTIATPEDRSDIVRHILYFTKYDATEIDYCFLIPGLTKTPQNKRQALIELVENYVLDNFKENKKSFILMAISRFIFGVSKIPQEKQKLALNRARPYIINVNPTGGSRIIESIGLCREGEFADVEKYANKMSNYITYGATNRSYLFKIFSNAERTQRKELLPLLEKAVSSEDYFYSSGFLAELAEIEGDNYIEVLKSLLLLTNMERNKGHRELVHVINRLRPSERENNIKTARLKGEGKKVDEVIKIFITLSSLPVALQ